MDSIECKAITDRIFLWFPEIARLIEQTK